MFVLNKLYIQTLM